MELGRCGTPKNRLLVRSLILPCPVELHAFITPRTLFHQPLGASASRYHRFARVPYADSHGSCYQWAYHTPGAASASTSFGEVTWFEDPEDASDIYHCRSACSCSSYCGDGYSGSSPRPCTGPFGTSNGGFLYITITGLGKDEPVAGWLNFEFLQPAPQILPTQLIAIKNIWQQNCWPTLQNLPVFNVHGTHPNKHWQKSAHTLGRYSVVRPDSAYLYRSAFNTTHGESDSDNIPFCDWMFDNTTLQTYDQVTSLTTSSCESISYVRCDADGNVIELLLYGRGLTGVLDWTQISALPRLKNLRLGGNKLEGAVLSNVFASPSLEQVSLNKNRFTGTIPCPTSTEPRLTAVDLSNNLFTGALPDCLFNQLPRLRDLDVSYNLLTTGSIPPSIQNAQQLVTFRATEAGLSGAIPSDLKCARKLITLAARGNSLSGTIPQLVIDGLPMLNTLDLSYNDLTGGIPSFPAGSSELRNLYLNNNQFSGAVGPQLLAFSLNQERTESSNVNIGYNALSGALPDVFYRMLTDAHGVGRLLVEGNNFRCDGETGDWPSWVWRIKSFAGGNPSRYAHTLGRCKRVPIVTSAATSARMGELLQLTGSDFLPTAELKCQFIVSTAGAYTVTALYRSPTVIDCVLPPTTSSTFPPSVIGATLEVTAANYGTDFFDATTHPTTYSAVSTTVAPASGEGGGAATTLPGGVGAPAPPPPTQPTSTGAVTCPAAPPPLPPPYPLGCHSVAVPTYTPATCTQSAPCEVPYGTDTRRYGCPIRVASLTSSTEEVYLKINRTRAGLRFKMEWNWNHGFPSGAPIVLFGYNDIPKYLPSLRQVYYEDCTRRCPANARVPRPLCTLSPTDGCSACWLHTHTPHMQTTGHRASTPRTNGSSTSQLTRTRIIARVRIAPATRATVRAAPTVATRSLPAAPRVTALAG